MKQKLHNLFLYLHNNPPLVAYLSIQIGVVLFATQLVLAYLVDTVLWPGPSNQNPGALEVLYWVFVVVSSIINSVFAGVAFSEKADETYC